MSAVGFLAVVGISLLTLVPGQIGGSETYARSLTRALAQVGTLDYCVLAPPLAADAGGGLPTEVVEDYGAATSIPARAVAMGRAALRRRIAGFEAIHYPLTVPLPRAGAPTVVTLHDVLHLDHPDLVPAAERLVRKVTYDHAARRAELVIVPSAFVRDRVAEQLRIDTARIRVIHHGIDHERFTPADVAREPFLLYPARPWPHKNHARLFEAFALIRRERPELELVLTGGGEHRHLPDAVVSRGLVSPDELVSLYRRAAALVFPSRYEGFGAPPLEAMACGCPVAVSRAGSLPEICGDAARYFDPDSPVSIADAVLAAAGMESPRDRAAAFTWVESARSHERVYRELARA